jgi:hypothetical protein
VATLAVAGCGEFRARPDLRTSTLTLPDQGTCAKGYKTRQTGNIGYYGTPLVEVTGELCDPKTDDEARSP